MDGLKPIVGNHNMGPAVPPTLHSPGQASPSPPAAHTKEDRLGQLVDGVAWHAGKHVLLRIVPSDGRGSTGAGEYFPASRTFPSPRRGKSVCIKDTISGAPWLRQGGDEMT